MSSKQKKARLLYADSEHSADMLYLGGIFVPDPFIAYQIGSVKTAVLNALEYNRGVKESNFDRILPYETCIEQAKLHFNKKQIKTADVIRWIANEEGISHFQVPREFPAGLAFELKDAGLQIEVLEAPFYPSREFKTSTELSAIREGNKASARGISEAEKVLRKSTIKQGKIYYEGKALTSERLRFHIECACLEAGAMPAHTIVAGGDQGCDPHCAGSGVLRANELIIIDVFPRNTATGYYGDMTRTFLKGKASDAQKALVATVLNAQKMAMSSIKAGVSAAKLHRSVVSYFEDAGYKTDKVNGVHRGFFHSTGHGLGLDIHESPRLGLTGPRLKKGMVVTIEPGLYYPGLGACRIEDVVHVKAGGYDKLSNFHYQWQIP